MKKLLLLSIIGALMLTDSACWAAIPHMINYQGMLTKSDGTSPVPDDDYNLTFKIYGSLSGVDSLWWEHHTHVLVTNGLFSVLLGSINPIPGPVFDDSVTYLGITVGTDPELSPRARLTSVGYAYHAWAAEIAEVSLYAPTGGGWTDDGAVVRLNTSSDSVGIGTTEPSARLDVEGDVNVNSVYRIGGKRVLDASGTRKICVGIGAGAASNGLNSTFVGDSAGYNNQGENNTFVGTWAGYSNGHGIYNTYLGYKAGYASSTGGSNTFLGCSAGSQNTTGGGNTFIGTWAGWRNTISSNNTFVGKNAGYYSDGGESNIFIGGGAGYHNHTGSYNTSLGWLAGYQNETGSGNVFIGHSAGYYEKGSNKLFIANSRDSSDVLIYGDFSTRRVGIGNLAPEGMLHIENSGSGAEAFLWIETSHSTNWHEAGIRIETPQNKWHLRMDDDTNNQIPDGALGLRSQDSGVETMTWAENGNVGIKNTNPAFALDVGGDINVSGNIRKGGTAYTHPDYVFEPDYKLMSLDELKKYVFENKSLPNVISAEDVKENEGFKMDELLIQMLEKIEEQTLYIFQLEERIAELERGK